jgi:NADH:ubiquinone oxidoreductase subunit K
MLEGPIGIASELIESWIRGGRALRYTLGGAIMLVAVAMIFVVLGKAGITDEQFAEIMAATFGVVAAILGLGVISYQRALDLTKKHQKIEAVEKRYEENPQKTQNAWDLARIKLESYLDRNISQVRTIFWLTVTVMLFGFVLIGYGVFNVFESPENIKPSIVAATSGILVNFIGATLLVIYKSTMQQAKEYMSIIERINAVGMSVQILENLGDENKELKEQTTAEISKQLLRLYTSNEKQKNG